MNIFQSMKEWKYLKSIIRMNISQKYERMNIFKKYERMNIFKNTKGWIYIWMNESMIEYI